MPENQTERKKRVHVIEHATPHVHALFESFREETGLSNPEIGKQLGYSAATVSKYRNNTFTGDLYEFERRIEDVVRASHIRSVVEIETWETKLSRKIAGSLNTIVKTNDVGIIRGPAGIGKTEAGRRWLADHSNALFITLYEGCCNAHYVHKCIFEYTKTKGFETSKKNRVEWNLAALADSHRPILVDNAHKATAGARKALFDFNDAAGTPIGMFANEEIIDAINANDQHFSRVGLSPIYKLSKEEVETEAHNILRSICPQHAQALLPYAITVAGNKGHLRALRKQINLMLQVMENPKKPVADPREAFRIAHKKLIRPYDL